jgi:hypothetical protein
VSKLLTEAFVEREYSRLGAAVVHIRCLCGKGSLASNVDNVAVVLLYHAGEELFGEEKRSNDVEIKDPPKASLGNIQNRCRICHSSVVNENGRVPMVGSYTISD